MLDSKILGLPVIVYVIIFITALAVDVPMVLLHKEEVKNEAMTQQAVFNTQLHLGHVEESLLQLSPTATPEATVTPYTKFRPGIASPSGLTPTPKK